MELDGNSKDLDQVIRDLKKSGINVASDGSIHFASKPPMTHDDLDRSACRIEAGSSLLMKTAVILGAEGEQKNSMESAIKLLSLKNSLIFSLNTLVGLGLPRSMVGLATKLPFDSLSSTLLSSPAVQFPLPSKPFAGRS